MPGPFRNTDAVLTIAQINDRKAIEVTAANDVAQSVFGYDAEELHGRSFMELVPDKISDLIDEYVEFEQDANDVGDVLKKVREFAMLNKDGNSVPFRLKVVRHNSNEHDEYMLIMQDAEERKKADAFFEMLRSQFDGHSSVEGDTGLRDRDTFGKILELAIQHLDSFEQGVCVAVVELDASEQLMAKYGVQACNKVAQNAAALCQQNLRSKDIVAQVDRDKLGLILLGTPPEPGKMVLNRLRWLISGQHTRTAQGVDVQTTASISFHPLEKGEEAETVIKQCEDKLADRPASNQNIVVMV